MIQYALLKVQWNVSTIDRPYFASKTLRDSTLLSGVTFSNYVNFDFSNLLKATITINNFNPNKYNYIVLKNGNEYSYWFIVDSIYSCANQWKVSIYNDVITNYCYNINSDFKSDVIYRAHCNRFDESTDDNTKVRFTLDTSSPIYDQNEQAPTRVTSVEELFAGSRTEDEIWIDRHVLGWLYFFVDPDKEYNCWDSANGETKFKPIPAVCRPQYSTKEYNIPVSCGIFCFPILETGYSINSFSLTPNDNLSIEQSSLTNFLKLNPDTSGVYSVQFSKIPPFKMDCISFSIDNSMYLNVGANSFFTEEDMLLDPSPCLLDLQDNAYSIYMLGLKNYENVSSDITQVFFMCGEVYCDIKEASARLPIETSFDKSELKETRNIKFEPQIASLTEIVLSCTNGDKINFNALKLANLHSFVKHETIDMTGSKTYISITYDSYYGNMTQLEWFGLQSNYNAGININSNYAAQYVNQTANVREAQIASQGLTLVLGLLATFITGSVGVGVAEVAAMNLTSSKLTDASKKILLDTGVSLGTSFLAGMGGIANTQYMQNATIRDIVTKGSSIKPANSNLASLIITQGGCNYYKLVKEPYMHDIISLYDDIYKRGYRLNRQGNIADYINTRHYFNYISCQITHINRDIPPQILAVIIRMFETGIRFWNTDEMYEYDKENYEVWL